MSVKTIKGVITQYKLIIYQRGAVGSGAHDQGPTLQNISLSPLTVPFITIHYRFHFLIRLSIYLACFLTRSFIISLLCPTRRPVLRSRHPTADSVPNSAPSSCGPSTLYIYCSPLKLLSDSLFATAVAYLACSLWTCYTTQWQCRMPIRYSPLKLGLLCAAQSAASHLFRYCLPWLNSSSALLPFLIMSQ